jgi:hypothetical protein
MKKYFDSVIVEQINRAHALKGLIRAPVHVPELSGLHERCTSLLNNQIQGLADLREELERREESDLRDIFRDIRLAARDISLVEYYGIPALHSQSKEAAFLNRVAFKISQEILLPIPPPAICHLSTEYYRSSIFTNVIFTPMGESRFLMHLPDIYHEIGHCVLGNAESEEKLKVVRDGRTDAFVKITEYYNQLRKEQRRTSGPDEILFAIGRIHSHWRMWLEEFLCDLFALYTAGPAYAWAHLHLTLKKSDNIHELSILTQSHPSDEARMRILLIGLRNTGFTEEASKIEQQWLEVTKFFSAPQSEYQYAYPDEMLNEIASSFRDALKRSGFSLFTPTMFQDEKTDQVRKLLNKSWQLFWKMKPEDYRKWEEEEIAKLGGSIYELLGT